MPLSPLVPLPRLFAIIANKAITGQWLSDRLHFAYVVIENKKKVTILTVKIKKKHTNLTTYIHVKVAPIQDKRLTLNKTIKQTSEHKFNTLWPIIWFQRYMILWKDKRNNGIIGKIQDSNMQKHWATSAAAPTAPPLPLLTNDKSVTCVKTRKSSSAKLQFVSNIFGVIYLFNNCDRPIVRSILC